MEQPRMSPLEDIIKHCSGRGILFDFALPVKPSEGIRFFAQSIQVCMWIVRRPHVHRSLYKGMEEKMDDASEV